MKEKLLPLLCLLPIPLLVWGGIAFSGGRHALLFSCLICLCALGFFYLGLPDRRIGGRRMVITAIFVALSCLGRLIPLFKPMAALTALGGIYLGPRSGFLIGSLSALISNFAFGQGPWTPFQMVGWGLIGLGAGLLSRPLRANRLLLSLYGALSALGYSALMDLFTVVWGSGFFSLPLYLSALITALPHTLSYLLSNLLFLLLLSAPMERKLARMKQKYGI